MSGVSDEISSSSDGEETLGERRLFDLLGNERRRACLQRLADCDGRIAVQDLASEVATRVSGEGCSPDEIRDSVYISLCQNHLSKLDEAGVVDYDSTEKVVGPGHAFPVVERRLLDDSGSVPDRATNRYYILASVTTVLVLTAATFGVGPALSYGLPALIAIHAIAILTLGRRYS